jgi:trk system potassium uptake protein TrkH
VIDAVWGYFTMYLVLFGLLMVLLMLTGVDQVTAWSAIATCMNNTGPALGDVTHNFRALRNWASGSARSRCCSATRDLHLVILFTPTFWRK